MSEVSPVRQKIDPDGQLPRVELMAEPGKTVPKGTRVPQRMLITSEDGVIGNTTVVVNTKEKSEHFNGVKLDDDYRGRGFGMATYLVAIERAHEQGRDFRSHDWTQTEAVARVWEKFIDAGIAEVVQPITYSHTEEDGTHKYTSDIRIRPEQ